MSTELSRFDPLFVSKLEQGSDEQLFVSSVGNVAFLTLQIHSTLRQIQIDLKEPLYEIGLNSPSSSVERALYFQSYGTMFETVLNNEGQHEYVVALNGLKDSLSRLKGRNISWTNSRRSTDDQLLRFDDYISDSVVGFYPDAPMTPMLSLGLNVDGSQNQRLVDIETMWDIGIYPK